MFIKRCFIVFLVIGQILVNGVAASVHITEDYQHNHDVPHQHFFSEQHTVINDDLHHDHEEGAHMHLEYQLSGPLLIQFQTDSVLDHTESEWLVPVISFSPPVPPPTS